ncbi:tyrosine-protein phosphatase [Isoptericola sp. AK164]|uniref:tyrosine-protein phosphatase n=1 Tax=Isoptericola sp. AK164 TaxID=3024246 RepID=UPI002418A7A3|nr:tyrosine-protein phosphatase [Isoptericola sp. AK164]
MSIETGTVPDRLVNLRDVATSSDAVRPGVLLRADAPRAGDVPPSDVVWPPRTVLDLRDPGEQREPHPLADVAGVLSLPVLDGATRVAPAEHRGPFDLGRLYLEMLDGAGGRHLAAGVAALATSDAPVLVHCTAGKDRTGVFVAAVLALLGVERSAIVADYVRTGPNMPRVLARARHTSRAPDRRSHVVAALPPELLTAPAHAISTVLDALAARDGGPAGWFAAQGGVASTVSSLRARMLRPSAPAPGATPAS